MKYFFIGEYVKGSSLGGAIDLGPKDTYGHPYLTDAALPPGLEPEIVEWKNEETGEIYWRIYLHTPLLNDYGTYGFCVRSDKSGVEPMTCLLEVGKHKKRPSA